SNPSDLTAIGSTLFFTANDGTTGRELWKSDGTAAGTMLVKDIHPRSSRPDAGHLTAPGHLPPFEAGDGATGLEVRNSNGTATGTALVKDINPGGKGILGDTPYYYGPPIQVAGGLAYVVADDGTSGHELWVTDGTAAGTMQVADLNPGV